MGLRKLKVMPGQAWSWDVVLPFTVGPDRANPNRNHLHGVGLRDRMQIRLSSGWLGEQGAPLPSTLQGTFGQPKVLYLLGSHVQNFGYGNELLCQTGELKM